MEKRTSGLKIALTGPESTGKSVMAEYLAGKFNGIFIPEYAREHVETIGRPYTFDDIKLIAKKQVQQYQEYKNEKAPVFFDTWLIITKIWFEWVYKKSPSWLDDQICNCPIDLFLLLKPDLPWEADPTRENGGENRIKLYNRYKHELEQNRYNFIEISGVGEQRFRNADSALRSIIVK